MNLVVCFVALSGLATSTAASKLLTTSGTEEMRRHLHDWSKGKHAKSRKKRIDSKSKSKGTGKGKNEKGKKKSRIQKKSKRRKKSTMVKSDSSMETAKSGRRGNRHLTACIGLFPGYTGRLRPMGWLEIEFPKDKDNVFDVEYDIVGLEQDVRGRIAIQEGKSCEDAALVGRQFWSHATMDDPWSVKYSCGYDGKTQGEFGVSDGLEYKEHIGHAVVIHAADETTIGCGILVKGRENCQTRQLSACISTFPDYVGPLSPSGKVEVSFSMDGSFEFSYDLKGLEAEAKAGVRIYSGTTCTDASSVGTRYWDRRNGPRKNPWKRVKYQSNEEGEAGDEFELSDGYNYAQHINHAVVVRSDDGSHIGCGLLVEGVQSCSS